MTPSTYRLVPYKQRTNYRKGGVSAIAKLEQEVALFSQLEHLWRLYTAKEKVVLLMDKQVEERE